MMHVAMDLPRISVDSLQRWLHIRRQYTHAHVALLDARRPEQQHRDACMQHIHQYIDALFAIAQPNLRINGRNFEDLHENDQEIEPFDEALDRHIWSLSDQRLKWDREIARTRTEKPREVETMLQDLFDRQQEPEDMVIDNKDEIKDEPLEERLALVEQVFKKASALSEELHQSIPVQSERSQRVKTVMKEVKALKP